MRYGELFREENEHVAERYRLTIDRLGRIPGENTVDPRFRSYFEKVASFLLFIDRVYGLCESGNVRKMSAGELAELNHSLYEDVLPAHYGESFANPAYAAQRMGAELGPLLSFLYTEIRGGIVYAFESRLTDITILNELFIEVYNLFEEGAGTEDGVPAVKEVQSALYWFVSDYCDVTVPYRIRESVDPALDFAAGIIMNSDLSDTRYLYFFGEYVGERELKVAEYLNSLDEETIGKMAHTFTEGYRKGFEVTGRNLAKKKTVTIRYELGFERMIRQAVLDFEAMGLAPHFLPGRRQLCEPDAGKAHGLPRLHAQSAVRLRPPVRPGHLPGQGVPGPEAGGFKGGLRAVEKGGRRLRGAGGGGDLRRGRL